MRLTKIELKGYRRLRETSCNVDGRLIALIGPNEAGKSSVLSALDWHSNGDGQPLAAFDRSRDADIADDTPSVRVTFVLEEDDLKELGDLDSDSLPARFVSSRTAGGSMQTGVYPRPLRSAGPRLKAASALKELFESPPEASLTGGGRGDVWERLLPRLLDQTMDLTPEDIALAQELTEGSAARIGDNRSA